MKNKFTRRDFLLVSGLSLTALSAHKVNASTKNMKELLVYIGTYTSNNTKSEGIYVYKLNLNSGELLPYKVVKDAVDPSFLAINKDENFLYAVNETEEYEGKKSGAVSAYKIEKNGDLVFLNKQASLGGSPCYATVSDNGKYVLVANYSGGNAVSFPVKDDGSLGEAIDLEQHTGSGINKKRQEAAHVHSVTLDHKNNFAVVCDLGMDKALIYRFDKENGQLQTNDSQQFFQGKLGAGPRHFAFHQNGKFAFIINELDSTLTSLLYDEKLGTLNAIQTVSTLPEDYSRASSNTCADVHISPDGRFVYGSNRGHDSIVSFKINEENGSLEYVEHVSTGGKVPRNFAIDPSGSFLLAANQKTNNIVVFRIEKETGRLQNTGFSVIVPSPVCLKIISLKD
jgi:6-phosphogluconolactonase